MKFLVLLISVSCLVHSVVGYGSGISNTVFSLANFQAENGGFTSQIMEGSPGNLEDTAHALFLASLFGVPHKINAEQATSFIETLKNKDQGYSNQPGQASDLESVRNALVSSLHLGSLPADTSGIVSFVESLWDSNTKLYRNGVGKAADFRATARALQIFDLLELEDAKTSERKSEIVAKLTTTLKTNDTKKYFSSITSDNSFAIIAGKLAGFQFGEDVKAFTSYYQLRQVNAGAQKGGFFSDDYATDVDVSDAENTLNALYSLQGKVENTVVNINALIGFLNSLPPSLSNAAHSYAAIGRLEAFQQFWKLTPVYVVKDSRFRITAASPRIVQGTVFRPNVYFRTSYGQAHSTAEVLVTITHAQKTEEKNFTYNPDTEHYLSSEFFDTSDLLGEVTLQYEVSWHIPGYDEITFVFEERKSIGYDVYITSVAELDDDNHPDPHENVQLGTSFSFELSLGTVSIPRPNLLSGDFNVDFSVLDSSNVVVHTDRLDATNNNAPIVFKYKLSEANIPAGRLTFRFALGSEEGFHTVEEVWYVLDVTMAASEIDFEEDQTLNFGQSIEVTIQPGTLSDGAVHAFPKSERSFFLDIYSEKNHVLLASYPGTPRGDAYTFEATIPARVDFIGKNVLSFRYQDAAGNNIPLKNFNTEENDLFDRDLFYTVDASLQAVDLSGAPHPGDLNYGDVVKFTFRLTDTWSEQTVSRGANDATIFLALRHTDGAGKEYTSTKVRGNPDRDSSGNIFSFAWEVDPNAVKGPAELALYALDADSNEIPINHEGEPWKVAVSVAGSLNIQEHVFSSVYDDFDSVFIVQFELTSEGRKLSGADFLARVSSADKKELFVLPVTSGEGVYQISWILPIEDAKTGNYVVDIYRKVDLETSKSANPFETKPFVTVSLPHKGLEVSPLPFKTEFIVLLISSVTAIIASVQKVQMEKK